MKEEMLLEKKVKEQVFMDEGQLFNGDRYIIEDALKDYMSEEEIARFSKNLDLNLFIVGRVDAIRTLDKEVIVDVVGDSGFLPKATFRFPPKKKIFLEEFRRAQNFDLKVRVVFMKTIKSLKVFRKKEFFPKS